ncbi:hypothetical protein [Ectobacillus ponti]|uniref:Uncharacterized protein n=1 Tax=Ectobacillus ponti TaxID=2961894 RepID=A0AA41X8U7_9BACI|nr:hypothetical protein [Ectobacillus ponti]MCP8968824.1 hypothetical protein [Ectobacillus ponti]
MICCEWQSFATEAETYTRDKFENIIGDKFEAMLVDDQGFPSYIWTANFVCIVTKRSKIVEEVEFRTIPRNPVCE